MNEMAFIERTLRETAPFVGEKYADRSALEVCSKSDPNDLLTEVDLAVQDRIVAAIRKEFPGDAIFAEERGLSAAGGTQETRCWLLDPIDGTQNFVRGLFPVFGISLALTVGGYPVAGGVILPVPEILFLAEEGAGATCNGRKLCVSDVNDLSLARVEVDFAGPAERRDTLQRGTRILTGAGQIRCGVCCVASLCSVASAEGDAFFHVGLSPWDYAAGMLLVEEAGGRTSRLDGSRVSVFDGKRGLLASNGHLHDSLLALV